MVSTTHALRSGGAIAPPAPPSVPPLQYYRRCVPKAGHVIAVLISARGGQSVAQFLLLLTWQSFAPPIQVNAVRPAH